MLGLTAVLTLIGVVRGGPEADSDPIAASNVNDGNAQTRQQPAASRASARGQPSPVATVTYPVVGSDTFAYALSASAVMGRAGPLLRFRVAVEKDVSGLSAAQFAAAATVALGSPDSWIGTGQWRLQQVPPGMPYDFTISLVTPATRDRLCADGYDRYTSCRNGDQVVLNVARWVHGVPNYGASLQAYRLYALNHEVGHRLGKPHERCPGGGQLAPVMQQQSLGLHGCRPNSWPMVDGRLYHGPVGAYDDPIPSQ